MRGQVFFADAEAAKLGRIHQSGVRGRLPARNPLFLLPAIAQRLRALLARGVDRIVAGRSTDLRSTLLEAATMAAEAMQRNIAPEGRLRSLHRGRHGRLFGPGRPALVDEGIPMYPLSRGYARQKLVKHGPRPILVATGHLWESIRARVVGS